MFNSSAKSWCDDTHANQTSLPHIERQIFVGTLITAIFHGIVVILFFQCMCAMLNRARGDVRWGLVALATAMFTLTTIILASFLDTMSISYINNRGFHSLNGAPLSGPLGYQTSTYRKAISFAASIMVPVNQWLADGLLLYRCYVIYAMKYWVIALPCLLYLASVSMGITAFYENLRPKPHESWPFVAVDYVTSYFSITFSLNVLLTLMIVARLIRYNKNIRSAMGALDGVDAWYRSIIIIFVESCAPYAISLLLYMGPHAAKHNVANAFYPMIAEAQVIAPLLIILRVANRTALTSEAIVTGHVDPIRFAGQETASDDETLPDWNRMNSMGAHGVTATAGGLGVETLHYNGA